MHFPTLTFALLLIVASASAQTAQFPNINVRTNATIGNNLTVSGNLLANDAFSLTNLFIGPQTNWLVFDGDSITAGTGASTKTYPYLLTNSYLSRSWIVSKTNAAVAGDTVAVRLAAYPTYVRPFKPTADHDSTLFFLCGINDLNIGTSGTNTFAALSNYWSAARADGFKICAFTIFDKNQFTGALQQERLIANKLIRDNPQLYDWLVDADSVIPVASTGTTIDGIHPTDETSAYLAWVVMDSLANYTRFGRNSQPIPQLGGSALKLISSGDYYNSVRGVHTIASYQGLTPISIYEDDSGDAFCIYPYNGSTRILWKDGAGNLNATTDQFLNFGTGGLTVSKNQILSAGKGKTITVGDTSVVNVLIAAQTNAVSGAFTFVHATNGVALVNYTAVRWLLNNSGSDQTFTIPATWKTNRLTTVPAALTNGTITKMTLECWGTTATAATQTNCMVNFEVY